MQYYNVYIKKKNFFISTIICVLLFVAPTVNAATSFTNPLTNDTTGMSIAGLIGRVLRGFLGIAGSLAVVFIILGGINIVFAAGSEDKITKGKKTLVMAILGLIIAFAGFMVVGVIINELGPTAVLMDTETRVIPNADGGSTREVDFTVSGHSGQNIEGTATFESPVTFTDPDTNIEYRFDPTEYTPQSGDIEIPQDSGSDLRVIETADGRVITIQDGQAFEIVENSTPLPPDYTVVQTGEGAVIIEDPAN